MRLRLKFNIVLAGVFLVGLSVAALVSHPLLQHHARQLFTDFMVCLAAVGLFVFIALNLMTVWRILRQIRRMAQAANRLSTGDFTQPECSERGRDEIAVLVQQALLKEYCHTDLLARQSNGLVHACAPSPWLYPMQYPAVAHRCADTQGQRNVLCAIVFIDLVGYCAHSLDEQVDLKKRLNEQVASALTTITWDSRLALDTGDGVALCLLGDPLDALRVALLLHDRLARPDDIALPARMGLHLGPVRVISDINDRVNVVGDGINTAQRVMDFAQPDQVWVSRAYYDIVIAIDPQLTHQFGYAGLHQDKHGRLHDLYVLQAPVRTALHPTTAQIEDAASRAAFCQEAGRILTQAHHRSLRPPDDPPRR